MGLFGVHFSVGTAGYLFSNWVYMSVPNFICAKVQFLAHTSLQFSEFTQWLLEPLSIHDTQATVIVITIIKTNSNNPLTETNLVFLSSSLLIVLSSILGFCFKRATPLCGQFLHGSSLPIFLNYRGYFFMSRFFLFE